MAGDVPPPSPDWCTQITDECTVEGTLYGYYPSLGANAFFLAFFALGFILNLGFGIRYKTWTYMIAMCLGCASETIGYAGRVMMNNNPYDTIGFQIQICCLIIAPAFFAAGIYLTLKHFTLTFGESWSRLRPAWYTYIFITGDIFSLVLQGAGGGIAATADNGSTMLDVGTNLMITGVVFQVVILFIFGFFLVEYTLRTYRRADQLSAQSLALLQDTKFRLFIGGILIAYLGIFTRCVYRIPELTGGWRSSLMRDEPSFIALEGVMITLSVLTMTIFHPGFCFPALGNTIGQKSKSKTFDEEGSTEMMQN
ncbi:sphingoid long-chain base transporter RSB1 [Lentithecium fluviatile CBS 122367]|uniref:Sphingoid long-chain base transporter RSB1 n=1 Tax=Lentithecium fluviatile CBS 122367 TaxID=1168545 RepID=A0A6G1ISF2_9PLEO|nr:sphingoid long-chain base transporter RSB1 [Lentithecium fluviatile CBS 122367]